jgi:hypothetical protein
MEKSAKIVKQNIKSTGRASNFESSTNPQNGRDSIDGKPAASSFCSLGSFSLAVVVVHLGLGDFFRESDQIDTETEILSQMAADDWIPQDRLTKFCSHVDPVPAALQLTLPSVAVPHAAAPLEIFERHPSQARLGKIENRFRLFE